MKKLTIMLMLIAVNPAFAKKSGARLTFLTGTAPVKLTTSNFGGVQRIAVTNDLVFGASFQVDTNDSKTQHVQFTGLSNGTILIGYGINL